MKLAEQIYTLRTRKNLSQTELADAMQVSRQSVSKWETGQSVPDLDKLMRMAELFDVTLDELVKGTKPTDAEPSSSDTAKELAALRKQLEKQSVKRPARQYVGIALIGVGALISLVCTLWGNALLEGLLLSAPFFVCGGWCLWMERPGLWCAWNVFACVWIYLESFSIGTISRFGAALCGYVPFDIAAWSGLAQLIVYLGLVIATAYRFARCRVQKPLVWVSATLVGLAALWFGKRTAIAVLAQNFQTGKYATSMTIAATVCKFGQMLLGAVLCVLAVQGIYQDEVNQHNKDAQ